MWFQWKNSIPIGKLEFKHVLVKFTICFIFNIK